MRASPGGRQRPRAAARATAHGHSPGRGEPDTGTAPGEGSAHRDPGQPSGRIRRSGLQPAAAPHAAGGQPTPAATVHHNRRSRSGRTTNQGRTDGASQRPRVIRGRGDDPTAWARADAHGPGEWQTPDATKTCRTAHARDARHQADAPPATLAAWSTRPGGREAEGQCTAHATRPRPPPPPGHHRTPQRTSRTTAAGRTMADPASKP